MLPASPSTAYQCEQLTINRECKILFDEQVIGERCATTFTVQSHKAEVAEKSMENGHYIYPLNMLPACPSTAYQHKPLTSTESARYYLMSMSLVKDVHLHEMCRFTKQK